MDLEIYSDGSTTKKMLLEYFPKEKRGFINLAIQLAEKFHKGRMRLNNESEFQHCLAVGLKTAEMGLGSKTVSAAILHDSLELGKNEKEIADEIKEKLGEDVIELVKELTRLPNEKAEKIGQFTHLSSAQKYILSSSKDMRVLMIKLAEKFHNLLTIDSLLKDKREQYITEIEKIYLPLSEYIGLGNIHKQLSDLVLMKRNKMKYDLINDFLTEKRNISDQTKEEIIEELQTLCELENVKAEVQGRTKSITSIYKKQIKYQKEGKLFSLENIFDIIAFRVITESIEDCYKIRSTLLNMYEEIESETEDYIAKPKPNGYKSIHLCLQHPKEGLLEIQIRTKEMHLYNEYGPASHIAYKESGKRFAQATDEYGWVRELHNQDTEEDKPIITELFSDSVFVFTPKGDILQLPKGSTIIDFAYNLHTTLGNQCSGATVNGKGVALGTKLNTGDIVELRIDKNKKHATEGWEEIAYTTTAKRRIRNSLGKKYNDSI